MSSEDFWRELRAHGFTKFQVLNGTGKRTVLLQSADGDYPSIGHPDDFTAEQRQAMLCTFLKKYVL